jgi:hypothetical protein
LGISTPEIARSLPRKKEYQSLKGVGDFN